MGSVSMGNASGVSNDAVYLAGHGLVPHFNCVW